jgi:glycosyltransferase involved in cell wall biosynthesis
MISEQFPDAGHLYAHGGGGEMSAYLLGKNIAEKGVSVTVVTNITSQGKACSVAGNLKVIRVPLLSQRFNGKYPFSDELRYLMTYFDNSRVEEIVRKIKPDVIHVEHKAVGFVQLGKIARTPTVLFVRDYWPLCLSGEFFNGKTPCFNCSQPNMLKCTIANGTYFLDIRRLPEIMYNLLFLPQRLFLSKNVLSRKQKMVKQADKVLVNSIYMKNLLKLYLKLEDEKIGVVYPPLPVFPYVAPSTTVNEQKTFAYIGWLTHGKGIINLLKAFHKAVRENPKIHLRIFGRGNMERYIGTYIVSNGLGHNISFEGFLEHSQFCQIMETTDVVIVPSLWPEPFGRITSEAMVCGRPVIINPVGGLTEQVEDSRTGFYANCYDIEALTKKILQVATMSREELTFIGKQARKSVLSKFDNNAQINALLSTYDQLQRTA